MLIIDNPGQFYDAVDIYPFLSETLNPEGVNLTAHGKITVINKKVIFNFSLGEVTPSTWRIINEAVQFAFQEAGLLERPLSS